MLYVYKYSNYTFFIRPKWIKLGNIEYRTGSIIVTGYDGLLPVFATVQELYLFMERPLINVKVLKTFGLHEHYCSYVIEETFTSIYTVTF